MPDNRLRPELFAFLRELKQNNDRDWFARNKDRYERDVRQPLLRFIADFAKPLGRLTPHLVADPRPQGGSMFRIHRDTRFSKDKTPYKTHASAQFRHRLGRDVHAPGFYLHLEPGRVFGGAGLWRPEPDALAAIRRALVTRSADWRKAVSGRAFRASCTLEGDFLMRPPRGFPPEHPLIEDIKRKDFIALTRWSDRDALAPGFLGEFTAFCKASMPLMRFLARAIKLEM
jgi:uncharacterized protein (TIGR02453 family)